MRLCFVALPLNGNNVVVTLTEATCNVGTVLVAVVAQAVCTIKPQPEK